MGNWINNRLVVRGSKKDLHVFNKAVLTLPPLNDYDVLPKEADSICGESVDLLIVGPNRWRPGVLEVRYLFQTKNYLPLKEFKLVSRSFPGLCFILGYCDANDCSFGSYFIRKGRSKEYELPEARLAPYMEDEDFQGWEPMDEVVRYWDEQAASILHQS